MKIASYIQFLLKSQNQHGLHSPFVYALVTRCFYDKTHYQEYTLLKKYRQALIKNNNTIRVTDFGAGSRVFKSRQRKIAAIAKNVGISEKRAKFLFRLAKYLNCRNILELGTSLGMGAAALALNRQAKVTTIEGCPETAAVARDHFRKFNLENIKLQVGEFSKIIPALLAKPNKAEGPSFDLVYFDGHHTLEATLENFERVLPTAYNDTVFVFDDIHWSQEMEEAWERIKDHPQVKLSIDTFYLGLIFFRREQVKQHFIIRL